MGVCSDKSARAEESTAEIPCCDNNAVRQLLLEKNIEDRYARRTLRLAVIGVAANLSVTQNISIDVVCCVPMLGFYFIDKGNRLVLSCDRLDIADKSRLFFDKFVICGFADGSVFHRRLLSDRLKKDGVKHRLFFIII